MCRCRRSAVSFAVSYQSHPTNRGCRRQVAVKYNFFFFFFFFLLRHLLLEMTKKCSEKLRVSMSIGSAGYRPNEAVLLRQRGGLRNKNRISGGTVQKPGLSSETSVVMRVGKPGGEYEKGKRVFQQRQWKEGNKRKEMKGMRLKKVEY